jgi:NAD(P)-dependent dehydrogenase (short-subunit alcohol dehydrogenase family)
MARLEGKIAIVTGGTGGIGRAIVERFAAEGARVVAADRNDPDPPFGEGGGAPVYQETDVTNAADVRALMDVTMARFGSLDVLVNNAGIEIEDGEKTIEETTEEEWNHLIDTNLKGVFLCTKYAIAPMRAKGGGSIINTGSISGFVADHKMPAYCASKGGVHMLTRCTAIDHGADGIRCNAVCPGWIMTEMTKKLFRKFPDPRAAEQGSVALHPVGRLGLPEDIANMALWLASDESGFTSGQFFTVDGGLTAASPIDTSMARPAE